MKPVYLEFCGVNSFSEKAEIDFRKLLDGGLFGIFGDTGSGKSTILDCIHFALYGRIERSTGTDSINYKCDKAYVVYDFEIVYDGKRRTYRVRRERRRKNNIAKAFLYELDERGEWQSLAEGTRDVDGRLEEIIGLGFDDFKKCIALPQGEFAGLVKAQNSERLQLVSRLFDLEKYGEKLSSAINERFKVVNDETTRLQAQMQENEGGRDEIIAEEREKVDAAKARLSEVVKQLEETEEELFAVKRLEEEKRGYEKLQAAYAVAKEKLPYYRELKGKLERFSPAAEISRTADSLNGCVKDKENALSAARLASSRLAAAESDLAILKKRLEESGTDGKIESLAQKIGALEAAAGDIVVCNEAKAKLDECVEKYRKIRDKFVEEDFETLLAQKAAEKEKLGEDGSFTEFVKHHFKDVLLAQEYGEVRADLKGLSDKYPETEEDVAALIKKYTLAERGSERSFDIATAQLAFKQTEIRRKALMQEIENITKRKNAYEDNEREKARLVEDGKHYRERYELAKKKIELVKDMGAPNDLKKQIEQLKNAKKRAEEEIQSLEEKKNACAAEAESKKALVGAYASREAELSETLASLLQANGFSSSAEAKALVAEIGEEGRAKEKCEEFFNGYRLTESRLSEISADKFNGLSETTSASLALKKMTLTSEKEALLKAVAVGEKEIERLKALKEKYELLKKQFAAKEKEKGQWEKLKSLTARGKFMEFIASEYLQDICSSASRTLLTLTNGRYFLKYNGEFQAGDNFNGGTVRSVKTLSGGETFLVSLSLALALSGAICAKSLRPIEFFFLDEGFGTLDENLVDSVMDVLEKLRSRNFSIGVISHVEELKHRIDRKILVSGATDTHGSSIQTEAY